MSDAIQQVIENLKFIQEAARLNGLTKTWTKAQESIDALQALQSAEPVVFTCHGNNAPAYGCNKPGDMSGTYYKAPQPVVPEQYNEMLVEYIRDDFDCLQGGDGWCFIDLDGQAEQLEYLRYHGLLIQHPDDLGRVKIKAVLPTSNGGDSDAPEMKTYRCVICNVSGTDDGLCYAHKYDEQLSKHKSAGKGGE